MPAIKGKKWKDGKRGKSNCYSLLSYIFSMPWAGGYLNSSFFGFFLWRTDIQGFIRNKTWPLGDT